MKNFNTLRNLLLVSAFVMVGSSCKDTFTAPASLSGTPISTIVSTNDNFNILTAVLRKTGQYASLNNINAGLVTLFAPSDAAFMTYFIGLNSFLATEQNVIDFVNGMTVSTTTPTIAALNSNLNYHIVSSKLTSDLITGNQVFATLNLARLSISKGALNPPTNPTGVLLNANSGATGAAVTILDAAIASNGVVHTIDKFMAVPGTSNVLSIPVATGLGLAVSYATNPPTVTGGTTTDGVSTNVNLFSALIRVTGLAPTLVPNASPLPDFTIFQPTDAVVTAYFQSIDATLTTEVLCYNYIASLISATPPAVPNPTLAQLTDIVKYHCVSGRFLTTDFTTGQVVNTLLTGSAVTVNIAGTVFTLADLNAGVTDPTITAKDILTNSGILHTINGVLRPL